MRARKIISFLASVVMMITMLVPIADASGTVIAVDDVTALKGETVTVPVRISQNSGMCGAVMSIHYDEALTLTDVTEGDAVQGLTLTKPGDMSANPAKVVFDGQDADYTNGIIMNLVFCVPETLGTYDIVLTYEADEIVDGDLKAMDVTMLNGSITVVEADIGGGGDVGDDEEEEEEELSGTVISVDKVKTLKGKRVTVPIRIRENPGIFGMTLTVSYDSALTLIDITSGEAMTSLEMSRPGDLSANPITLMYIGMENDTTNGIISNLVFDVPETLGKYSISISCAEDDIIDENLNPVEVGTQNGRITVSETIIDEPDEPGETEEPPVITIDSVVAKAGQSIDVPVSIEGNTGICGAVLFIEYDEALTLTNITRGDALTGLAMTKPGNLPVNPVKLLFDGIEEDSTSGTVVVLSFTAPQSEGTYEISAYYEEEGIVNGDMYPIEPVIMDGSITVKGNSVNIYIGEESFKLSSDIEEKGTVYVAFYDKEKQLISLELFTPNGTDVKTDAPSDAVWTKIMWWTAKQTPMCDEITVQLKDGINVDVGGKNVMLIPDFKSEGTIYVGFYTSTGQLSSIQLFTPDGNDIKANTDLNADYAKVMWWTGAQKPITEAEKILLK